ncbi:hypothetical protein [Streptomyces sp. NPDC001743]|uniref:hypothetical protein n=1 Tax=Streptomyces sp. NPDC001743 TaxID=3154397 RepID=UPI00332385B1
MLPPAVRLFAIGEFRDIAPGECAEARAARVERSRVIREPVQRFVFLLEEAVLDYGICEAEVRAPSSATR